MRLDRTRLPEPCDAAIADVRRKGNPLREIHGYQARRVVATIPNQNSRN